MRASSVVSVSLSIRSLARARFPFLFHEIHRRTRVERNKVSTPSSPELWAWGRCWRWRLNQIGNLDLDFHACRRTGWGIDDVCRIGCSKLTKEGHHRRRHHPTVIALQRIAAKITGRAPHSRRRHPTIVALHGTAARITGRAAKITGRAAHCRRHHPTVMALHGIAAKITRRAAGLGLWAKQSKEYYC